MAVNGPKTGFVIVNADGGPTSQDLGDRYVSRDYLMDVYPNIAYNVLGSRISPGLYAWGRNNHGQLGDNSARINRSSPVQAGSLVNWRFISAGRYHTVATKTDGTLWAWGRNAVGNLGTSNTTSRSSPFQVGSLANWRLVATGQYHSLAVKTDGSLWAWGHNAQGQVGNGTSGLTGISSPVPIGALRNWKLVSAGRYISASVKTDGSLWTWGAGTSGAGGRPTTANVSSPVRVGTQSNWSMVACGFSHMAAVTTDGKLWTWGPGTSGALGLNDTTNRSSPTQVGTLTNWKYVACGNETTFAIKTDGTLWGWGLNANGQLGLNDRTNRSSPSQVGLLTNWKLVNTSTDTLSVYTTLAIKTDGSLWAWGTSVYGELGDETLVSKSSPVQVGSLTNWKAVTLGQQHSVGILDWSM